VFTLLLQTLELQTYGNNKMKISLQTLFL